MDNESSPLHQLFQKLIVEEKLNPILAQKLLEEILRIIAKHHKK